MKHLIAFAFFINWLPSYSQSSDGLIVYCPFDGNISNSVVGGPSNSFQGNPSFTSDRSARGNSCALQIMTNSFLNTNYAIASNDKFTFSFFFKLDNPKQEGIMLGRYPALALKNDTLQFTEWGSRIGVKVKLVLGKWHYISFSLNGLTMNAYIDAVWIGKFEISRYLESFNYIGNGNEFAIDDLRIYNRVLFLTEIKNLYNLPSSCALTGVDSEVGMETSKQIVGMYDVLGKKLPENTQDRGLHIIHFEDGTKKKVLR